MSFLSLSPRFSAVRYLEDDAQSLVPKVLCVPGGQRHQLASLSPCGPAVYIALYEDRPSLDGPLCYVGVSGDFRQRAGESPHLDQYGRVEQLFVITEANGHLTLPMARAAERIVWESMHEIGGYATIGNIPLGAPLAEAYDGVRAFCGRALQVIAASGQALVDISAKALLAGARGNSDLTFNVEPDFIAGNLYRYSARGLSAHAVETVEGEWVLLAGSQVAAVPTVSSGPLLRVRLESMLFHGTLVAHPDNDDCLIAREPLIFGSASGAALFVTGSKGGSNHWRRVGRVGSDQANMVAAAGPVSLH